MPVRDFSSEQARHELRELVGYEDWLLHSVYKLTEDELFPAWPDAVVYDADTKSSIVRNFGRGNVVLFDWRPGFLQVAPPLVFVASFKLLDMLFEWVLKGNGQPADFRFKEKIKQLASPGLVYPSVLHARPWLVAALMALYKCSEPLRGTIIHSRHFDSSNGGLRIASSKNEVIGERIDLSAEDLRTYAQLSVSVLKYLHGDWHLDAHREKCLRWQIDALQKLHRLEPLGQAQPRHMCVRWNTRDPNIRIVDVPRLQRDILERNPGQDVAFDLRIVITDDERNSPRAYLIPCEVLPRLDSLPEERWSDYISPIPDETEVAASIQKVGQ